jgi:hypothetical protein
MFKRTSLKDAKRVEIAYDLVDVFRATRAGCRVTAAKARRQQRSYMIRLTDEIVLRAQDVVYKIVE